MKILCKGNKLVRDNIPEIIKSKGCGCSFTQLSDNDYIEAIKNKIGEETKELLDAKSKEEKIEELADLYEILEAFCKAENIDYEEVLKEKENKKQQKGAFEEKIYLLDYEKETND